VYSAYSAYTGQDHIQTPTARANDGSKVVSTVFKGFLTRIFPPLCVAAMLLPSALGEQPRISFPGNPRFTVERLEDQYGLGAVTVTCMGQDAQGFLWIGTQTGLYRYDGARARKMTEVEEITGHYIVDLLIAPDGTAWFAGNRGIAHLKNGEFEALPIPAEMMPLAAGNQIFAVDSKGTVFVLLFKGGVLRIDAGKTGNTKVFGPAEGIPENAAGIARGSDDVIWITTGTRLAHLEAGGSAFAVDPGIKLPKDRVVALLFDGSQTMWLRTATHLARLDPRMHEISLERAVTGSSNEEEGKPSVDQRGRLLVPTSAGLYWKREDRWQVVTDRQGITSNDVQFALEDREGTLWIAGSGTGLDRLPGVREWSAWTSAEGLPDNSTWSTLRDQSGRLWVSTGRGIGIWEESSHQWRRVSTLEGNGQREIRQIQLAGDGAVWGVTPTGAIVRIDPRDFSRTVSPLYHGRAFSTVYAAPDGSMWASTRTRLVRFTPGKGLAEPKDIPLPAEASGIEYLSFAPSGVLWGTGPGALYRFDGKEWKTFTAKDGLRGQTVTSVVAVNDNEVWVGYNDVVGVSHVQLERSGAVRFDHRNWDWTVIIRDSKGRVWFNGTDGLGVLSPDSRLQRLNHADGLLWDDVSPWTGVREEKDGSFVVATSRGLARYRPAGEVRTEVPAKVMITSVTLGGVERKVSDVPAVPASDGALAVQFTPLNLDNPGRTTCHYQLKGMEAQSTQTELREIRYGAIPAGRYEFFVQCWQEGSRATAAQASFRFRVLPSFWQTGWARASGVALLLVAVWGFVTLRTRTESRRRRELEQAVAQRNAELLQKNKELEEVSLTDPLTATRNRRYFYETISTDIAQALRSHLKSLDPGATPGLRQELIFVLVDIDRFKRVNDELGHAAGDRLLQEVAKRIASVMRRSDDLVRWGGEEFLLVCRTTDRQSASLLCERVLEAVRELPFDVGNGVEVHKTCSIGWAPFPWLKEDVGLLSIDNVIELADKALYLAKREGRNRSFGMLPAADAFKSERRISMESLRDCPPDLVQIV
jgi:diguanylate cyclase (GGDEF)-like protein